MKQITIISLLVIQCLTCRSQVVANFSANPTSLCAGQTVQFTDMSTGGPTAWNWSFPGGTPATSTLQNPSVTYTSAGSYNVVLSAANIGLPSVNTKLGYINVTAPPSAPGLISGPVAVCQGQVASYSVAPVSGAFTYSWSAPGTATILSGQGSNIVSVLITGTVVNLCVKAGNNCGYGSSSCLPVTGLPLPVVSVSPASSTICAGSSVTLTASGGTVYSWSPSSGLSSSSGSSVIASPSVSTSYTVTGSNGLCSNTAVANVNVISNPTVTVNPAFTVLCTSGSVAITATGASSYSWNPSAGLSSSAGSMVIASPTANTSYTVTGTQNGCVGRAVSSVTVTSIPPGSAGVIVGTPLACAGLTGTYMISPVANASTYSWTPPSGSSIISGQGTTTVTIAFSNSSGSVCVKAGNGCGYGPTSCLPVLPLAQPTVVVSPSSATLCSGSSVTLSATGAASYSWSPSSNLSSTSGSTVVASPTANIIYTVTGTSTAGCTGAASSTILVNPVPTVVINPPYPSICGSGSVTLVASGAASYIWSPTVGLNTSTGATVIASPGVTTSYTATGTSTNGCTGKAAVTVTVTIVPPLLAGAVSGPTSGCSGNQATYTVSAVAGASGYSWTVPAGSSLLSGQGSSLVTVQFGSTSGNICVSAQNACGNGPQACISVTVNQTPTVVVSPVSATVCAGNFISLNASGANTYSWSPSTYLSSTAGPTVYAGPLTDITYTVTGTLANGCFATAVSALSVVAVPVLTLMPVQPAICTNGSITLTAAGALTYTWLPSASLSSSSGSSVISSPSVNTTYTVVGTGTNGCQGYAITTVTVSSTPPSAPGQISGPAALCQNSQYTYSVAPATGAVTYSWTAPSGATIISGQGSNVITIAAGSAAGNICVTAANGCGSSAASCMTVNASPAPVVLVLATSSVICPGGSSTLTASGAATYSWSPAQGLNTTSGALVVASSAGIYTVTGTAASGCSAFAVITISSGTPPAAPDVKGPSAACKGAQVIFTLTPQPGNAYTWAVTGGLQVSTGSSPHATVTANDNGTVCIVATNTCGSGPSTCLDLAVKSPPSITVNVSGTITCLVPTVNVSAAATSTDVSYDWHIPGAGTSTESSFQSSWPGTYTLYAGYSQLSCYSSATLDVQQQKKAPAFSASVVPAECLGSVSKNNGTIILTGNVSGMRYDIQKAPKYNGPATFSAAAAVPQGGILTSTLMNPSIEDSYSILVFGDNGCFRDTTVKLKREICENEIFVPQAFTPDGDGKNDLYVISGLPTGGQNKLTIYNRWGAKVYESDDYNNSWDGHSNQGQSSSEKLPRGTYYYVLEFTGRELSPMTGFIVLQY